MKYRQIVAGLTLFIAAAAATHTVLAQSKPTASQQLQLSAFAAGTGTFTDLEGGKNAGITAGIDIAYLRFRLFKPAVEIRGTYPIKDGTINNQKNFLAGPKIEYPMGRLHPYADFLVGRGQITYQCGCFIVPVITPDGAVDYLDFLSSNSTVYSPGGGVDYDLTPRLAFKADVQFQHWDIPFPPGVISPRAISFGAVYHFDFNPHHRHRVR